MWDPTAVTFLLLILFYLPDTVICFNKKNIELELGDSYSNFKNHQSVLYYNLPFLKN